MSDQIVNRLKQVQTNIKGSRRLPFPVEQTQKEVQQTNRFVQQVFLKGAGLVIPKDAQAHIAQGLAETNRLLGQLIQNCPSEHHYQLYRHQFAEAMETIHSLCNCVRLSIDNGFYEIEPRGFSLYSSVELSWQRVQEIAHSFLQSQKSLYFPDNLLSNQKLQTFVRQHYQSIEPIAIPLLKNKPDNLAIHRFDVPALKQINQYFALVRKLYHHLDQERLQYAQVAAPAPVDSPQQIISEVHKLEQKIQRYCAGVEHPLLRHALRFDETTSTDLQSDLHSIYIQLEAPRILVEREHTLTQCLTRDPQTGLQDFFKTIAFEKRQLQFFIGNLSRFTQSLSAVSSILANLSISFGKIYQLSSKANITKQFVVRAFQTAHNLLSRSIQFAEARQTDSQHLQMALHKATLFQKSLEGAIIEGLKELEAAKQGVMNYDQKLTVKLKQALEVQLPTPALLQETIREAYEERSELTAAAMFLNNVSYNFDLLASELSKIDRAYAQIPADAPDGPPEAIAGILRSYSACPEKLLNKLWNDIQHLDWFIEEVLLEGIREERRFKDECEIFLKPVEQRKIAKKLQAEKIQRQAERQKQIEAKKAAGAKDDEFNSPTSLRKKGAGSSAQSDSFRIKPKSGASKTEDSSSDSNSPRVQPVSKKTGYSPFNPETTQKLLKACHGIATERALSIHELLERPHAFFDYLNRLEEQYDPNSPFGEDFYLEELRDSQSALDFVLGFAKMKFLPNGYYNANGDAIPFDPETGSFSDIMGTDRYLKVSSRVLETPKAIFGRILRVMMGYEEPAALSQVENEAVIEILKIDHILRDDEKIQLHDVLPFVS